MLIFNYLIVYGSTIQEDCEERSSKGRCGGKVLPAAGLVTLGDNATLDDIAYVMKEKSSLTLGDIQSVLTNFVEAMITTLYSGQSVNIKNFGVFSLSARTAGVLDVKECTAKNIKAVKINFRPSSTVRPDIAATRAGQKIDFYDLEALVNKGDGEGGSSGGGSGSGDGGGSDGDQGENPLG